ncbi:MAG: hypothetical protein ABIP07_01110 [Sphingomicrobium sp.]
MSARGFGSLIWAGAVAGAALGFYLVSLRVASERAALEGVETEIAMAQRDIRLLQTELGTRGRLAQLERWNVRFIRLSAPSADQFVDGGFQLATLVKPQARPAIEAPVVLASAPVHLPAEPRLGGDADQSIAITSRASRPVSDMVHVASYSALEPLSAPKRMAVTPPRPAATAPVRTDLTPGVKKTPATKPVKIARADPLAPLSPPGAKAKGNKPGGGPAAGASSRIQLKDSVTD